MSISFSDEINLQGEFSIFGRQKGETEWKHIIQKHNMIVTTGKQLVRDLLSGQVTGTKIQSFALGTGVTPPTLSDTGLGTPIYYSGTDTYKLFEEYTNDAANQITYVGYIPTTEPVTQPVDISEIGVFTGSLATAGIMYARATFSPFTKTTALELRVEYILKF